MNTTIYYFSGTGNSLKVANDLSDQLTDSKIVKISKSNMSVFSDTQSDKIGFVFPVYNAGIPVIVKNFIEKLQINKHTYVFAIVTCGAMAGSAPNQVKKILAKKDIKLAASFTVFMPGNNQLVYQPASEEKQNKLFINEKEQIYKIASAIKSSQHVEYKVNSIMSAVYNLGYRATFNPKAMGKNFWTDEKCIGCGICSKVCPASNIVMYEGKPKWEHQCESCLACMQWCPQKSIQYKKSTVKRGRYHHPDITVTDLIQK
ncbi:4Fe-4S ferredoxin iron-sulfur binding domain-containing protein [Clostridium sp. DL-VIII]|uniref:EFR1 family ferrodoxin n=1 Tax=Clostridium sp. DL-VIII TaxID=641107 RepID=UPI00023AF96B|nr:EFR1 family ferrodoxin [Clostridium sp. DL-VIII]EHI99981.1 4Fe-4S ferredoxin iron-sulfur binding domain-containing protein [Clostridium sp. DL-VIII]